MGQVANFYLRHKRIVQGRISGGAWAPGPTPEFLKGKGAPPPT